MPRKRPICADCGGNLDSFHLARPSPLLDLSAGLWPMCDVPALGSARRHAAVLLRRMSP
jgi:hypothetical protein